MAGLSPTTPFGVQNSTASSSGSEVVRQLLCRTRLKWAAQWLSKSSDVRCCLSDDTWLTEQIVRAQAREVRGDREGARAVYAELWDAALHTPDQYRACVVAHFMAHAQSEPEAQLVWHLRALRAADAALASGDERVRSFYPSLHANLGDVYLRQGDRTSARQHIQWAQVVQNTLSDDAYGHTVRALIVRLADAIEHDHPA